MLLVNGVTFPGSRRVLDISQAILLIASNCPKPGQVRALDLSIRSTYIGRLPTWFCTCLERFCYIFWGTFAGLAPIASRRGSSFCNVPSFNICLIGWSLNQSWLWLTTYDEKCRFFKHLFGMSLCQVAVSLHVNPPQQHFWLLMCFSSYWSFNVCSVRHGDPREELLRHWWIVLLSYQTSLFWMKYIM